MGQNVLRKCSSLHVHVMIPGVRPEAESTITFTVLDYFYTDNSSRFDGNPRFRFLV